MKKLLVLGVIGVLGLVVAGLFAPSAVLRGWLIGFASIGAVPLGCLAWLAIHGLTGGRWGVVAQPALICGASALPLLILLLAPLLLAARFLYPWASHGDAAGPGVTALYLNAPSVALRGLVLLGGLSFFVFRLSVRPDGAAMRRIAAALCLVLYGVGMDLSAFDWVLSLDPRFTSSAFGMQIIVEQLMAGLCFAILMTKAPSADLAWRDFAALLLACVLGETYLVLMSLIVDWYGDLPEQALWYLRRTENGWRLLEALALVVGSIAPLTALLFDRVRRSPKLLRRVAVAVLAGALIENVWLIAPGEQAAATLLAGLAATLVSASLLAAFASHRVAASGFAQSHPAGRLTDGA